MELGDFVTITSTGNIFPRNEENFIKLNFKNKEKNDICELDINIFQIFGKSTILSNDVLAVRNIYNQDMELLVAKSGLRIIALKNMEKEFLKIALTIDPDAFDNLKNRLLKQLKK